MPDQGGRRPEMPADDGQRARELRQGAAPAVAATVCRLVERDHGVAVAAQVFDPGQETRAVAGPAVREQHIRLALRVAPDIGVDVQAVEDRKSTRLNSSHSYDTRM